MDPATLKTVHAAIAVGVTLLVFLSLQLRRSVPTDLLFISGLAIVTLTGVISPQQALAGFGNPAVVTICGLLAVSAGLRSSGVLDWVGHRLLGGVHSERGALRQLAWSMIATSAFVLNTALVAMMMPVLVDWCRRRNISPSRLLMPLSYLVILGGVCTLIGTSTTLVVNGMLREMHQQRTAQLEQQLPADEESANQQRQLVEGVRPLGFFEIGRVGLPCAAVGAVVLLLFGRRLLPNRTDMLEQLDEQRREYLVEMLVQADCRLIGQSIEQAGLRHLHGLYLIEIDRDGDILTPVPPETTIRAGDRFVFAGVVSTIAQLETIPGLVPAVDMNYEFEPGDRQRRHLTEAVLSRTSPLIGTTVRKADFRQQYNAAVVAVHRNGVRLSNKIGNIVLEPGDTLLLQTQTDFVARYRNSRDFYLVSDLGGSEARRHDRALLAGGLALALIVWMSLTSPLEGWAWPGITSPAVAALVVVALMIVSRCLRVADARAAIDMPLVLTIVGALGLGRALTQSGVAETLARTLVTLVDDPFMLLVVVYLLTLVFTELITNVAVAAMLIPIAVEVAAGGGCNPRPFIMAVTLAASLSFVTPIGYQTNLMVMGPGGYRPRDFLWLGTPVAVAVIITALALIPRAWPF